MMLAKIFMIIGGLPFVLLGLMHIIYTLQDITRPRKLVPGDLTLIDQMRASPLRLTTETDMWQAWVGFNLSHGLGAMFFGGIYLTLAVTDMGVMRANPVLSIFAVLVSLGYFILARRYWFRIPAIGTGIGFAAFSVAAFLTLGLI